MAINECGKRDGNVETYGCDVSRPNFAKLYIAFVNRYLLL